MDDIKNSPFFKEIETEFWHHKNILNEWGKENSHSDLVNDTPYPKESLFRMIDLIEIMDNMVSFSPLGTDYETVKQSWDNNLI